MKLLKEQDLLNWFQENKIIDYSKIKNDLYDIHYIFEIDGVEFSIISWEQYSKSHLNYLQSQGVNEIITYGPMWDICCKFANNGGDKAYELNKFNNYIKDSLNYVKNKNTWNSFIKKEKGSE